MAETLGYKIYKNLPWWFQNVICSSKAIFVLRERYGKEYKKATEFLEASQWWSYNELVEYQNEKLCEVIKHAYETVPYYRELFEKLKLKPFDIKTVDDLPKLPILNKETVRARFTDMISTAWPKNNIIMGQTGGTTGTALRLASSKETIQWQWAIWQRHQRRFGINEKDSKITFGARGIVPLNNMNPPFWRRIVPMNRTYVSIHHMTTENMPILIEYLNRRNVKVYNGYPSGLYLLANYLLENNISIKHPPKHVVSGTESLLPYQRLAIEKALSTEVCDQYGASEYCGNISECEKHSYHVDMEFGIVELIHNDMLPPEQRRIILTGLHNPVMPLIRYDIGDIATIKSGTCSCGRQSPLVAAIDGRIEGYILTPDGRRLGRLDVLFKDTENIREIQLIQKQIESVTLKIAKRPEYTSEDEAALLKNVRKYLGDIITINVEYVDMIPRESNGKFRQVVSSVFKDKIRTSLEKTANERK
ncbi:MAG: phenylacetate--CoA ligase family protein [Sedimentisphaerales bacterium]|jgi:phenylacetate-CoA ligase